MVLLMQEGVELVLPQYFVLYNLKYYHYKFFMFIFPQINFKLDWINFGKNYYKIMFMARKYYLLILVLVHIDLYH